MKFTPLVEHFAELLCYPECHQLLLHLRNPERWPLPEGAGVDQFVSELVGEPRRWAEFILANQDDPGFDMRAQALETAALKVEAEADAADRADRVEVEI